MTLIKAKSVCYRGVILKVTEEGLPHADFNCSAQDNKDMVVLNAYV
jgi:hypothetical protein